MNYVYIQFLAIQQTVHFSRPGLFYQLHVYDCFKLCKLGCCVTMFYVYLFTSFYSAICLWVCAQYNVLLFNFIDMHVIFYVSWVKGLDNTRVTDCPYPQEKRKNVQNIMQKLLHVACLLCIVFCVLSFRIWHMRTFWSAFRFQTAASAKIRSQKPFYWTTSQANESFLPPCFDDVGIHATMKQNPL